MTTSTEEIFVYCSICYSTLTLLLCPYFGYCLYRFISVCHENGSDKYFKHRHPILNILFLLCFFIAYFILNPLEGILGIFNYENSLINKHIDLMDDLAAVLIFAIFISRSWLLFSDWSFHYNMKSWIWKREINPLHSNCIIKYRQIFGNKKCCILLIFFILFLPTIIILDIIPLIFINKTNEILFRIAIILFFVLFTLFVIISQLKRILDVYNIRKELLYEISIFGSLLLFSEIVTNSLEITNIINHTQQILLRSVFSTLNGILVIYIGTNWVLNKFKQYIRFQELGAVIDQNENTQKYQMLNTDELIIILNTEKGFECFLHHLVNEMQLEKMLFVVEVLQFKQEIKRRLENMDIEHELDKSSQEWLKLNYVIHDARDSSPSPPINDDKLDVLVLSGINIESLKLPQDPRLSQWTLYQFAVHLYDKYFEDGASLQLCVTAECSKFIYGFFQNRLISPNNACFPTPKLSSTNINDAEDDDDDKDDENDENVRRVSQTQESEIELAVNIDDVLDDATNENTADVMNGDDNIAMVYDLFRLYDYTLIEIWHPICSQIFNRFKITTEYGKIYAKIYNHKHTEQSNLLKSLYKAKPALQLVADFSNSHKQKKQTE